MLQDELVGTTRFCYWNRDRMFVVLNRIARSPFYNVLDVAEAKIKEMSGDAINWNQVHAKNRFAPQLK